MFRRFRGRVTVRAGRAPATYPPLSRGAYRSAIGQLRTSEVVRPLVDDDTPCSTREMPLCDIEQPSLI